MHVFPRTHTYWYKITMLFPLRIRTLLAWQRVPTTLPYANATLRQPTLRYGNPTLAQPMPTLPCPSLTVPCPALR